MKDNLSFIALGGGETIGASCYYLSVGDKHIMLDCGKAVKGKVGYGPDMEALYKTELDSLAQTDAVLISHGHYDHIGHIAEIIQSCENTPVFATEKTKLFARFLIDDVTLAEREKLSIEKQLMHDERIARALERIVPMGYFLPYEIKPGLKVTFFEAGHIPGAAMIYVEAGGRKILYTGDFSMQGTALAPGCILPSSIKPDTVIVCGVHAKHPRYTCREEIGIKLRLASEALRRNEPVHLGVKQLTKGIELVNFVREQMENVPIYVDKRIWELANIMEMQGTTVFDKNCHYGNFKKSNKPWGIYIGAEWFERYFTNSYNVDFSLHATYEDIKALLKFYKPENAIIVHTTQDCGSVEDVVLAKELPDINVIYAHNGQEYKI